MSRRAKTGICDECGADKVRVWKSDGYVSPRHQHGAQLCTFCRNDTHLGRMDWDRRMSVLMHALVAEVKHATRIERRRAGGGHV